MPKSITANEFCALLKSGKPLDVIDVRTPVEYREIHIDIAKNVPLDRLNPAAVQAERNGSAGSTLFVVCRSGARGAQACEKFLSAGITDVVNVEGGTLACAAAGAPVIRGKKSIPLNCQVQIITGTLTIIGSALAFWVNPAWVALPAAMGAGLFYSGVTNTCAMGSILARMPWNQVTSCPSA